MINCDRNQISKNMGAVRVKVKLTNAIDEELVKRGLLNPNLLRVYEAEALIDSGAVRTAIPLEVCEHLGLRIRSQEIAKYADGRQETVGLTGPILIELEGRETIEAAMVLGDSVLIGQTVLETLDLLVDCKNQRLVPNPENPERPVLRV
ncbi:MAG: clan AA aspartic protease [Microcoleus sp. PH2017_29_MFU_D_A]|uniref:clan AA aspartic protease n=2 Tax=unclassified Microcoleus TaxID=2642155 RepID=UPI001D6789B1|nr:MULTISPECIES: clan AA aspartic protease [unclassified Microcoleus]MCC3466621.1 clan AA aspartic protease [Microcoleus sp. PH2017_06_SFM_O_A]TAE11221.1 MAG: clan AA aspartic protease [Oscillatoriales cyanobacterium]MCC3412480.1 clan AA aspartic protease [Microcoleus sp. PH2017_02_FOX_O_A]MCC3423927.1 clan AA aspartic protease [Microcoleus sp. PH2017_01_SCD_O_A]MCC3450874.1 clan AA aspartic protease [Microcoleus sp. PH2017_09_SFU_O_A]